jgi:ubiquinone/menaquinone biosynthesis C-methylase UbiE
MRRVPEPEIMSGGDDVEAYASAAVQAHLQKIDNNFVDHVLRLGVHTGIALDVGCGPAQIPIALLQRLPSLRFVGIDQSPAMLEEAKRAAQSAGVADRLLLTLASADSLCFADATFDLLCCNSVLHHFSHPVQALNELGRVVRPQGAVLLRDLRRPGWLAFPWHVGWYGRHYTGTMYKLFRASVAAAYTAEELKQMVAAVPGLTGSAIFHQWRSHIGVARPPRCT